MNKQVIKNRIRKIIAYTVTSIGFFLISAFLTLQIPAVQEYLIGRYLGSFSSAIGFKSSIASFRLLWFDRLELEGLTVLDPESHEMITARKLLVNFKLSQLLSNGDVNIDGVAVTDARVYLTYIPEGDTSTNLNITMFLDRINEQFASSESGTGRTPRVNIGEAIISESKFTYVDQERDSIKHGFNYNQFSFDINEAQLQNFLILGDTTQFNIKTLLARDPKSGLSIKEFTTFFHLSQTSMQFRDLNAKINDSFIGDSIIFKFNGQRELQDFNEKINMHGDLRNTILQPKDLALFAPEVAHMKKPIYVNGVFNGKVKNFKFTNMALTMGNTTLRGSVDMEGLPDIAETFIILDLKNSTVDFNDFDFAIEPDFMTRLTPMGKMTLDGEFTGYTNDFVATGNFAGDIGNIASDINFKVNKKDFNRSTYSGKLVLSDFDLGRYLADTVNFQKVTMNGKIKGSGLTKSTADFTLNGRVNSIGLLNYNYTNIETNARFASELFNGLFKIDDPNLQFTARGSVDLRKGNDIIKVQADIDTAYIHKLGFSKDYIFVHSGVDVNTKGLELDSLVGRVDLQDFYVEYKDQHLSLPAINVRSDKTKRERLVEIESSIVDADIKGDFLLSDISYDVETLIKEIVLNIRNDKHELQNYYTNKTYRPKSYETNFNVNLKDIRPLVDLLKVNLHVSNKTKVEGKFTSGYSSILQAYAQIDSFEYNDALFLKVEAELTASKLSDSTDVLAMLSINSNRQQLNKNLQTKNFLAEAIWNKNHIRFGLDADQVETTNYVRLKGEVNFLKDSTQLKMLPSTINVLDRSWQVDPANLVSMNGKNINVQNLRIRHENQSILFNGRVSEDPSKKLALTVNNLDLSILNPITGRNIKGTLEAKFDLTNFYKDPYVQNDISIDSLIINDFLIGDVIGKNQWDTLENKFVIDFFIDRNDSRIVNLTGDYNPRSKNPLNVNARLDKANLKIAEPFVDDMFSKIGGTITGDYQITGTLDSPQLNGEGNVENGQIMINYLKTFYNFTGIVGLSPNSVYFKDIEMSDLLHNRGTLSGTITHTAFRDTRINIDAAFTNFQVLNTTMKDNTLFYGQGYATGNVNIFGPVSNLKFTANAKTAKNTRISIPIGGVTEVEKKEFIKFVSFSDSTFQKNLTDQISTKLDLTGITMDFNLDVTPDAYCEIILDLKAGDIIRGRGNGELQFQLDTKGEFNMFGPFEFTEGTYTFTLYDLVSKDFEIKKGSRITWYGDAYEGNLDLSATYNQLASFAPIISDQTLASSPQLRRKYPTQVLIKLDGPMLSPLINFDIAAKDLPQSIIVDNQPVRLDFEFQAFKNKMDEQELKRQVFSLIVLRRFSPPESFNTSGSIVNSVSEFLSNQLSNWMSQVDENLEVAVDLSTLDEAAFNTFQLRLSYTFLNGRLRVTRDGTFYGNQNGTNINNSQANISSIAGDWTVDYLLTANGMLKIKMYNRTNINPINTINSNYPVTTGVSLTHTQTFNEIRDIWRAARNRKKKNPQPDQNTNKEAVRKDNGGAE
jgi:hypothetical protein